MTDKITAYLRVVREREARDNAPGQCVFEDDPYSSSIYYDREEAASGSGWSRYELVDVVTVSYPPDARVMTLKRYDMVDVSGCENWQMIERPSGAFVRFDDIPLDLLAKVLKQAEYDNAQVEGEFAVGAAERKRHEAERADIETLRMIAGIPSDD